MRPSWFPLAVAPPLAFPTVNQTLPNGPLATPCATAPRLAVCSVYSVILPEVVIRPILPWPSLNQRAPSAPATIWKGGDVGTWYSVSDPPVVIRPIRWPPACANCVSVDHSAPSGPAVIPSGVLDELDIASSVRWPSDVMRPIFPRWPPDSVNHTAPSGPLVMYWAAALGSGNGYSASRPAESARPLI